MEENIKATDSHNGTQNYAAKVYLLIYHEFNTIDVR